MENFTEEQLELRQLADECIEETDKLLNDGQLKKSMAMALRAKDIYEQIGDRYSLARTMNLLSIIYTEMGNDALDLDYLLDAVEIALDENYYDLSTRYLNNIGSKYMATRSYDQALLYLKKSIEMLEKGIKEGTIDPDKSHDVNMIVNMNIAATYCEIGDMQNASIHYEIAKKESLHPDNADSLFTFQSFEGLILWRLGRREKAQSLVDEIIASASQIDYVQDYMDIMRDLLALLKEMRNDAQWESTLKLMEEHVTEEQGLRNLLEVQKFWIEYYETTENMEKYREACVRFYELSKEMEKSDDVRRGENIALKIEMRRTLRQKEITDSIVYLDPLTGIANRNRMLEDSNIYIEQALQNHSPIMIGLIDVDFFKECNDTYGHIQGDECLKAVAEIIRDAVDDFGNVYRYGGDEFLLLLPNASKDDAMQIGQTIKTQLEAAQIANEKSPISRYITVSQGYTRAYAEEGDSIVQLINLADRALYSVKRSGRNAYRFTPLNELIQL